MDGVSRRKVKRHPTVKKWAGRKLVKILTVGKKGTEVPKDIQGSYKNDKREGRNNPRAMW